MRKSCRAIIIKNGKVLTMFRRKIKDGVTTEYYVIPGGGQESGETKEETVKRELSEEMNVDIQILGYLGDEISETGKASYFHCEIIKGEPSLGGEELDRMTKENYYEPIFLNIEDLDKINLFGKEFVRKAIKKEYIS